MAAYSGRCTGRSSASAPARRPGFECRYGLGELGILDASRSAPLLDLGELRTRARKVALGHERLAHVLARQDVVGIDRERLLIEGERGVDVAELARDETRLVQKARISRVSGLLEDCQRLSILAAMRQPVGGIVDLVLAKLPVIPFAFRLVLVRLLRAVSPRRGRRLRTRS